MARPPKLSHYTAIFLFSLAILVLEIAISRVLSVALYSHYAFVAISLAMFGLSLGALVVYLWPQSFTPARLDRQLRQCAALFGLAAALSVLFFLHVHVAQELSWRGFWTLGLAYGVLSIPFFLGGLSVSLLMTHFSGSIGRIYFADLLGASVGCIAVVSGMHVMPAPLVALAVACLMCGASLVATVLVDGRAWRIPALASAAVAVLVGSAAATNIFTMRYIKSQKPFYSRSELWNGFSRVSAFDPGCNAAGVVPLKGDPASYPDVPGTMMLDIDGAAWTPMMNFTGDLSSIQFLRESVLYVAHHLRAHADVLIIGTGGGRDILAALAFGQQSVTGIEINPLMRETVEERYGEYSGHPYSRPGVRVIIDEGRSRLSHLNQQFDILQLSLIDTFSLNAAGGFVFSENYLYTTEALREYYQHLTPEGLLTLTRYYVPSYPLEIQRLAALVRAAWSAEGVGNVADHVVALVQGVSATMLVKRSPFTPAEIEQVEHIAAENNIGVLYRPGASKGQGQELARILTTPDLPALLRASPFTITPPTDDQPFFFNFLRGRFHGESMDPFEFLKLWDQALALMHMLIAVVTAMAAVFLVGPLLVLGRGGIKRVGIHVAIPLLLYFACLGYGFMLIEIPLLQQFILFLGYPVYALAVVLFGLLLFSGIGSLFSTRLASFDIRAIVGVLISVMGVASLYRWILPALITALLPLPIAGRIAVTIVLLAPIGLVLGAAYPMGITILRRYGEDLVPWAWGLNGAVSVVGSVLAVFIGSRAGFSTALLTGIAAYGLALLCVAPALIVESAATEVPQSLHAAHTG